MSINILLITQFWLTWRYFVDIFHSALSTKEIFQVISQIQLFLSIFILHNTNKCLSSIINEIPTTFLLMQRFEVTVKTKSCFVSHLCSSDETKHVHMYTRQLILLRILAAPQGSLSFPDTGVTLITYLTHEVFSISETKLSLDFSYLYPKFPVANHN